MHQSHQESKRKIRQCNVVAGARDPLLADIDEQVADHVGRIS